MILFVILILLLSSLARNCKKTNFQHRAWTAESNNSSKTQKLLKCTFRCEMRAPCPPMEWPVMDFFTGSTDMNRQVCSGAITFTY